MTQSGYSFTPGKYDPVRQTDVVTEQEKSNARILESEERFLDEMNARDDALVEKTRSEWESLSSLSSSFAGWMEKKACPTLRMGPPYSELGFGDGSTELSLR